MRGNSHGLVDVGGAVVSEGGAGGSVTIWKRCIGVGGLAVVVVGSEGVVAGWQPLRVQQQSSAIGRRKVVTGEDFIAC